MAATFVPSYPFVHLPECTPLTPAACCRAAEFLRSKLSPADIEEFVSVMGGSPLVPKVEPDSPVTILFDRVSPRVRNTLVHSKISTVAELITKTPEELRKTPRFGPRAVEQIEQALASIGFQLKKSEE